ncbi:glycosyltransferase family 4 protein [Saccharococcus caldoxylosilyticus]|uniref:glycosyltransferase family 4 protein n=1 Tax=Saccharococcus caldoxylosilyticus TaxID=81408 RepID=UPI003D338543
MSSYYDFLMIGWGLDYSRNRVLLSKDRHHYKSIEIEKDGYLIRNIKIFFKTLFAFIKYKSKIVYIPAFNQANAPLIILFSKIFKKKIIIDILVSEYDTIVDDRKLVKKQSFKAKKAFFYDYISTKYADILICDTESHKKYFKEKFGVNETKMKVIPVGAEDIFRPIETKNNQENVEKDVIRVLFYGGFSPLHGIDKILYAAKYLEDENVRFTLVGKGQTWEEMVELSKKLCLRNVEFIDNIDYRKLPYFISQFDIGLGIFGDTGKAMRVVPNKVYQLAACAKPIISRETPGIKEVFTDMQDIILVSNKGDLSKELADKIRFLKEHSNLRKIIGDNAYKLMKENYSVKSIEDRFANLIDNLRNNK